MIPTDSSDTFTKNKLQTEMLVRWDYCICLSIIALFILVSGPIVLFVFPLILLSIQTYGFEYKKAFRLFKSFKRPSSSTQKIFQDQFSPPRLTFFRFADGIEPQCISLFLIHMILLPMEYNEGEVDDSMKYFVSHEISHARFLDFSSISWVVASGLILTLVAVDQGDLQFFINVMEKAQKTGTSDIGSEIFLLYSMALLFLTALYLRNMMYRKEHYADLSAFQKFPDATIRCLQREVRRKQLSKSLDIISKFRSFVTHPKTEDRLHFFDVKNAYSSADLIFSGFILGLYLNIFVMLIAFAGLTFSESRFSVNTIAFVFLTFLIVYELNVSFQKYCEYMLSQKNKWFDKSNIGFGIGAALPIVVFNFIRRENPSHLNEVLNEYMFVGDLVLIVFCITPILAIVLLNAFSHASNFIKLKFRMPFLDLLLLFVPVSIIVATSLIFAMSGQFSFYPIKILLLSFAGIVVIELLALGCVKSIKFSFR